MDDHLAEFGKYRIISELGRGGMGVVYLAEDGLLNRKVALKVLYEHLNRESAFVSRFQEEARSVSSLHHRNIVCVHGMEQAKNAFAIDMEYVEGLSLDRFAAATRISPPLAARLGSDILEGLVTCHDIGIVHRDIKPSNILVGSDSVAKITDFGLATAYAIHVKTTIAGGTSNGYFMGTPRYASPAAWDGQSPIPAWDLYSLGVILFELLSGKIAFAGESPMAIMKQHLTTTLPPMGNVAPAVSPELARVVDELLSAKGEATTMTSLDALKSLQETPEFDRAEKCDSTATVSMAVRRQKGRRHIKKMVPWVRRAFAASTLIALVGLLAWVLKNEVDAPPQESTPDHVVRRLDAPQVLLRPQSISGVAQDNSLWMLENNVKGRPQRIVALNPLGLWHLELQPTQEENRYEVKGSWAEYLRDGNARVLLGDTSGFLLIAPEEGYLSLAIELVSERDNSREQLNLIARPIPEPNDSSQFVRAIESSDAVQSLLYNELLPRNYAWASDIEALMPAFENGRIEVPDTSADVLIDGILDELTWTKPPFNVDGRLAEIPEGGTGEARLLVRWTPAAVVIGIEAQNVPAGALLDIGLLPGVEISSQNSRRFFASLSVEGLNKTHSTAGSRELPWECDWQGAATTRDGHYQAEIRIPTDQFNMLSAPGEGRRWRLNVVLNGAAGGDPLAYWGQKESSAPEHGALITFREAKS